MTLPAFTLHRHGASAPTVADLPYGFASAAAESTALPHLPIRNALLGGLPAHELAHLRPFLQRVPLESRQVLAEPNMPIRHVYFPETAIISFVSQLSDGGMVEVGTAGCDGMAGLSLFLGSASASTCAFVQIPGTALRMDADVFQGVAGESGCLHRILLRYSHAFLTQVAQTAACNGAHLVDQRCARWLLMTHDRVDGNEFPLTHELMALMLGVRRPGVTLAMRALQDAGLVRYTRGRVEISDRPGLEQASCECYQVVRAHFAPLLPQQALA